MSLTAFSYSLEQGNSIIVSESLRQDALTAPPEMDLNKHFYELRKLMERDLKLHWHIVSLSDYWREGLIPRGLRIAKFPSFGIDDAAFKKKWESILNKCSMDLMLLLIEQAKTEKAALTERLQTLKAERQVSDAQVPFEEKLKADLAKLELNIKQTKMRKLKRDEDDYKRDQVYLWEKRSRHQRAQIHRSPRTPRERTVSFNLTSSEEDIHHTAPATSPPRLQRSSFLEEEWPLPRAPPHQPQHARRAEDGKKQQKKKTRDNVAVRTSQRNRVRIHYPR